MKRFLKKFTDKKGSVIIIAMIALVILTIIGISAITNTNMELQISRNDRLNKVAFFAAEAGRGYVVGHPALYNSQNISGTAVPFPDSANAATTYQLPGSTQTFNGTVTLRSSALSRIVPRGSGFGYGQYRAYRYVLQSTGYGPDNSSRTVEQGFYRIGL